VTARPSSAGTRRDLAAAHRLAVRDGLSEGAWNHFSAMDPQQAGVMLVTPAGNHWSRITASGLAAIGADGRAVGGGEPTRGGWLIHFSMHRALPHVRCLLHVHSPCLTALSMLEGDAFDTRASKQAARFHGDVAWHEVSDRDPDGEEEGDAMARAMGGRKVLLLRNHGAVVAGSSVGDAYVDLYRLERAAMFQVMAAGQGRPLTRLSEEIATSLADHARGRSSEASFAAMRSVIEAEEPDFAG